MCDDGYGINPTVKSPKRLERKKSRKVVIKKLKKNKVVRRKNVGQAKRKARK